MKECGQNITILTNDQQLYRLAVYVNWITKRDIRILYQGSVACTCLSFIGCVGVLMADSGLEDIMKSSLGGVAQMLSGK